MAGEDLLQIRVTADFKQAEESFLKLSKTATTFESDIRKISANVSREFNKIEGSAELFGNSTTVIADKMKVLKNAMENLMSLGFQAMNPHVQKLKAQYDELGKSLGNLTPEVDKSSKKLGASNKTMMSLSLILQDLPYGFRGIQNNLPALVGSFAAATGAIYLGFSALIAITTAYEKEIVQLIYGIDDLAVANKKMNESIADNVGQAKSQIATDQSLLKIINDTSQSTDNRKKALKELKEEYKGNLELQKLDITDAGKLATVYNKISDALIRKARATAYAQLIAEEEAKILKLETQQGEEVVKNLGFMGTAYGLVTSGLGGFSASANIATAAFGKQAKQINTSKTNIALFTQKLNENTEAQIENSDATNTNNTGGKKGGGKKSKNPALEAQIQAGKDIMYIAEKNTKEFEALEKAQIEGARRAGMAGGNIEYIKEPELDPKARAKAFAEKMAFDKKMSKERVDQLKEQYQLEVSEAQGSFEQIKLAEENMRNALNKGFMDGSIKLSEYLFSINELRKKSNKTISDESKAAMQETLKMGIGIMNALGPALDMLLEKSANIGEVLSQAFSDVLKKLVKVIIAAAVAVALLALIFPKTLSKAGGAGKVFGNLVGGGMGLGTQLFANGGIVSGPTLGLMGEYPGASSNPEVVAPLDKLKDMMGSGGGTLETRISGNDLLILVNKANRNNSNTF
jgi:hypothetical protein